MIGTLYIVATPIGNLGDISLRALETLKKVEVIASEDTRKTQILLSHYQIEKKLISYHQHSDEKRKKEILLYLLRGFDIALVTDAGTPGISDPGNELINFLLSKEPEIKIVSIPGASSLTVSLSLCGFDVSKFLFLGFWPKKKLTKTLEMVSMVKVPVVFFESPFRVLKTLDKLIESLGSEREVFVARELTKIYETFYRGSLKEVKEKLLKDKIKGELVVVLKAR